MSTILSSYNLSGGDTTSSVFTYSGATRNLDIEIITTSISGTNTYVTIETSADQSNWILVPDSQIQINRGSDSYVYHITESEGAYVRAKVYRMDSHSGAVTITAAEPSGGGGGGDLLAANNLSDLANPPIENQILFGDASSQATSSDKFTWDEGKEIFTVNGGQKVKQTEVVDSDYTVLTSDYEVLASGLTASRTITLPTASTARNQIFIIKVSSTAALLYYINVVVSGGTDTINGLVNYKFISGQDSLVLISDGTSNYNIVADSLKPINHLLAQNTGVTGNSLATTVLTFTDSSANLTNHIPLYFTIQVVTGTLGICVVKFKTSVNDCTTTVALVNATGNNMIYIPVIAGAVFPNSGNISVEVTVASVAASTFTVNCYGTSR